MIQKLDLTNIALEAKHIELFNAIHSLKNQSAAYQYSVTVTFLVFSHFQAYLIHHITHAVTMSLNILLQISNGLCDRPPILTVADLQSCSPAAAGSADPCRGAGNFLWHKTSLMADK